MGTYRQIPRLKMSVLAWALFFLRVQTCPPVINAWGKEGHQMIANIGYRRLSDAARSAVDTLLNTTNSTMFTPLAAIANWADKVRYTKQYHWSAPLHFVDIRDDEIEGGCSCTPRPALEFLDQEPQNPCTFIYSRDCTFNMCAVGAIVNYTTRLSNVILAPHLGQEFTDQDQAQKRFLKAKDYIHIHNNSRKWALQESLMFVTHFIGDIHQPLHCSRKTDKGGNAIHVEFDHDMSGIIIDSRDLTLHSKWNLHSVWDTAMIERAINEIFGGSQIRFERSIESLIGLAENSGEINAWLNCSDGRDLRCASLWAEESWEDALKWAYSNEEGNEISDGEKLTMDYFLTRLPVVERRIAAAGVRLASSLEAVLAG